MSVARKILIVDDEEDIVNLTEKFLQLENYETLTCSSGSEALEIVEEKHEDIALVLLDIMMPGLSGFEVLRNIKSNEKFNHILVVLFTVKNFFKDIKKVNQLGADGYIVKAISVNEIVNYIENLLKKNKKKKE